MGNSKITLVAFMLVFLLITVLGAFSIQSVDALTLDAEKETIQLTEAQKKEIGALQKDILEKKKELISKYVKFGVMPKEKGEKIISRLEKRYEKLQQNGFIPQRDKVKKKHRQ
ncbi:YckD family protein [Clostridiaceae bacterium 35-E11]